VTELSGSVILTVTLATPALLSVALTLISMVTPVVNTLLFAGVKLMRFGGVLSLTVKLVTSVSFTLPLVSAAVIVTL